MLSVTFVSKSYISSSDMLCCHGTASHQKSMCLKCIAMQVVEKATFGTDEEPAVPITVRQLEGLVRISESLAKMQLQMNATEAHVQQAVTLFKASTMDAVASGATEGLVGPFAFSGCLYELVDNIAPLHNLQVCCYSGLMWHVLSHASFALLYHSCQHALLHWMSDCSHHVRVYLQQ